MKNAETIRDWLSKVLLAGMLSLVVVDSSTANTNSLVQGVSLANPAVPGPAGGNSDSSASIISADGRFVLFLSTANNLVANDNNGPVLDVFLRNRTNSATTLISANVTGTSGGNGHSTFPGISADGRFAVFESLADDLVANDTNDASDVFLRDLQTGTTTLVSASSDSVGSANSNSTSPVITPDGRYVAFTSEASNLLPNDSNGIPDVFVRDLQTGTTTLVSVNAQDSGGARDGSHAPAITPDGRYVAFVSTASNLVAGVTNIYSEVYVRDLVAGTTFWVSTNAASIALSVTGLTTNSVASYNPAISTDGRYVAFKTASRFTNVVLVLRHDLATGATSLVSRDAIGTFVPIADASGPVMTPDARFVAYTGRIFFTSSSSADHVYRWDAQNASNVLVSASMDGTTTTNSLSDTPAISSDGRYVAFLSDANGLVTNATGGNYHVYVRDLVAGNTELISVDTSGNGSAAADAAIPTISADGRFVAFDSFDDDYVPGDDNSAADVFVRDRVAGTTELISKSNSAFQLLTGNNLSSVSINSISTDGRFVAFVSIASNLVPNDTNGFQDVFVRDLQIGTNHLASVNRDGTNSGKGFSGSPFISANGRHVAFVSNADDLVSGDTNRLDDIFVRDLQSGITTLVSVSSNNATGGNGSSSSPVISGDSRYVAFSSRSSNLAPGDANANPDAFWRDSQAGTTIAITTNGLLLSFLSMSADGRFIAYFTNGFPAQLCVWDSEVRSNIFTIAGSRSTEFVISADGRVLVHQATSTSGIYAYDRVAGTNILVGSTAFQGRPNAQISGNSRYVAYVSSLDGVVPNDGNGTNDVFLYNLQTGTTTLVSVNRDWTGAANGPSDSPSISVDGRYVAFRSYASDIIAGDNNDQPDVFVFDRLTGKNTLLSIRQTIATTGDNRSSTPVISASGSTVVFRSVASDLIDGDLNNNQDVFFYCIRQTVVVDSDADGMEDAWEQAYFGNLVKNGLADSDGDGVSDLNEYKSGTNPASGESVFAGELVSQPVGGQATITWPATPGRTYRVRYKNDLNEANWSDLVGNVTVSGATAELVDKTAGTISQRFYWVTLVE